MKSGWASGWGAEKEEGEKSSQSSHRKDPFFFPTRPYSELKRKIKNDFYESEQLFCDQKPGLL